jgi:Galactose oxidase-like, Early set domain/Fibronectin type III domain/Glyoxal oxidase N-terminus
VVTALLACGLLVVSAGAAASGPVFVQQVTGHSAGVTSLALKPASSITTSNRLVVLVGVWSSSNATASSVTDSAGNTYTELVHFKASDGTEMSVWSAPITVGGGTQPTVTIKPNAKADVGAALSEYSGLSTAAGAGAVDQTATATGTTAGAALVSSGPTAPITTGNELAVGMYVDSGFGDTVTAGAGWTQRSIVSKTGDMELLTEDQTLSAAGAAPNASAATGANTIWLMATVVFASANSSTATVPAAPTGVTTTGGDSSATVSWTAPSNGGSPITSYTVTPYVNSTAQPATTVTGSPPATNVTINGLTNGTSYTFTVAATNSVGTGPASAQSAAVIPAATNGGQWSPLMNWPMTAIHSILLDNGKVLQFDGWQQPEPTQVWDPATQTFATQTAPDSIFCSGMAELPDGRVLVIGGYGGLSTGKIGIVDTNIFDPSTNTWTRVANMHNPRWYPDLTELADGRYVAISGNTTDESHWADNPEVYDPTTNTWTVLSSVSTSQVHEQEYPFSYLIPNGNVFTIGPSEDVSFELNVQNQTWTPVGGASGITNGSSVMYRPGKILYSGGTPTQDPSSPAQATTAVIDLNASTPTWRQTAPMSNARIYHTLTMLADGTVLAVGGEKTWGQTGQTEVSGGVLPSEIWNPNTETWSPAAPTATTRGYHSTAILMPDGTVLIGGSGHANPGYPAQTTSQIYSPPYLFKGPRPTIASAPAAATYGSTIPVSTPDAASISAVNLVSLGSDTHQSDMDQHFVPLSFTQGSGGLNIQIPSSAATAPPGNYMLFILNSNGVPSVASFINIAPTLSAPAAPTGVSAAPGNASATVSWTAPSDGGSPITSYTVTPYVGSTAQTPTTVDGNATSTPISGLTNGTTYTFTVTATNSVGTSPPSSPSNSVTPGAVTAPGFVQSAAAHATSVSTLSVTPTSPISAGNRIVVEAGVWSSGSATAKSVTDSAGNTYTELLHFKASDNTELSVWSAPVTAGGGTKPSITVTPTAKADVGAAALEYSGTSSVADATVMDQSKTGSGKTSGAATVSSGATPATTAGNELAIGFYADSGFGDTLTAGSGFMQRANVSNAPDMELLAEDQYLPASGSTPNANAGTGASTIWLMATVVLKGGTAGGGAAAATQIAGAAKIGGAQTIGTTQTSGNVASLLVAHDVVMPAMPRAACVNLRRGHGHKTACASVRRAAKITARARARFIFDALLKNLPSSLFCYHGRVPLGGSWAAWFKPAGRS